MPDEWAVRWSNGQVEVCADERTALELYSARNWVATKGGYALSPDRGKRYVTELLRRPNWEKVL